MNLKPTKVYLFLWLLPLLLFGLTSCLPEPNEDPDRIGPSQGITPWSENQRYWANEEGKPILLLGTVSQKNLPQSPNYALELEELHRAGGNYVRCEINLSAVDSAYWTNFHDFIRLAASLDIFVQLELPSVDGAVADLALSRAVADQALSISKPYKNILYSSAEAPQETDLPDKINAAVYVESYPFSNALPFREDPGLKTIPTHYSAVYGNDPYDLIKNFNLAVMNGYAGLCHAPSRATFEMRNARLASIRAIRTVERHLKFWDLKPAPDVLIGDNAAAATDGAGNFLFYMPTAGEINVRLPVEDQVPIRVIVVGYLGTQKSELLQPPYGDSFKLFTEEIRGGWMILKREG